jgi:small-conductance mechanosensitive channel
MLLQTSKRRGTRLSLLRWLYLLLPLLCLATPIQAASPPPATAADQPAKVRELLGLLGDPQVQEWIKAQQAAHEAKPAAPTGEAKSADLLAGRLAGIRAHMQALIAIAPQMPAQFQRAADAVLAETQGRGLIPILLAVFIGLGLAVAWLFLWATRGLRRRGSELPVDKVGQRVTALVARLVYGALLVTAFGLGSIGAFLIFDWPPLLREILLGYLLAFLGFCLAMLLLRFLLAPGTPGKEDTNKYRVLPMTGEAARFWYRRFLILAGWFAFGYTTVTLLHDLGFELDAQRLVAYVLGLGLLAIGFDMVWRHPAASAVAGSSSVLRRRAIAWLLSIYFVLLWALWVASAVRFMWLLIVLAAVPWAIRGVHRAVTHLLRPPEGTDAAVAAVPSLVTIALERGLRALLIIGGALLLADKWQIDLVALTSNDTVLTRLIRGLLSTVVIVLVADFGWQLAKTAIDRKIVEAPKTGDQHSQEWRRQARMKTLLPIFRNVLFIVLIVMVALMALAAVGVDIGPLVAGASVVGVAIGFGAQTLVRDIISGMFYLLDDAFRVGEYIQSGNYKGTVESFSLRSVKLRHHRGPLYTVPFGVLGAIQNMSRDWVIDKLSVGVTYDTDLNKVKKIIKQIGKELMEDPELAPKIMETLKMQGVGQFGDYAIQIQMKMMTKPGEQFVIRRRAYAMIKKAFDANGINFAYPTVQVAGGGETPPSAAIASAAQQALAKPVPAEG